jgi:hypothetical protein
MPQRSLEENAEGRIRTDMGVAPQRFLRPPRLPFRHSGLLETAEKTPVFQRPQLRPHLTELGEVGTQLERKMGFEPTTFSLARRHSTAELLPLAQSGAERRSRTADTRIFSPLLYL